MNKKTAKTRLQLLEEGLAILEQQGWCQGVIQDNKTKAVCSIGALEAAAYGLTTKGSIRAGYDLGLGPTGLTDAVDLLVASIPKNQVNRGAAWYTSRSLVASWNDKRGRTVEQVKSLYARAIAKAKKTDAAVG